MPKQRKKEKQKAGKRVKTMKSGKKEQEGDLKKKPEEQPVEVKAMTSRERKGKRI